MSLRPFGRSKVLVTDANGKMVSQTNQASADLVVNQVTGALVGNVTGSLNASGAGNHIKNPLAVVVASGDTSVMAAQSGTVFVATATSGTQTFTLPTAAVGLEYTFITGHADGEIIIKPSATGQLISGKGFAVTHPAGIENDAGTNAVGDAVTLVATSGTDWWAKSTIGTWSTDAS